ncbi:S4A7-like protein [Mya arenaria]|uniref:S4A7-like protein n=1 Tax=Mya arenaria TaxID=6604 RepID=A0ABY7EMK6_MYAAR|nr:S4A7-like protein [Mya arenaria]
MADDPKAMEEGGLKDRGITREVSSSDLEDHASSRHRMVLGVRMPKRPKRPRKRRSNKSGERQPHSDFNVQPAVQSPTETVQNLLGEVDDEQHRPHSTFTQMDILFPFGQDKQWREYARWVKYEEDLEEGGERWSKPHVASLSLHSLFELRSAILNGAVILDLDAYHISQITDNFIANKMMDEDMREEIRKVMTSAHVFAHQKRKRSLMPGRSKMATSKSFSEPEQLNMNGHIKESPSMAKLNTDFMRKITPGSQACNVMVGEVPNLKYQLSAFVRLSEARMIGDITEVPIPTRFVFIHLGPKDTEDKCIEIGRSMSTLLVDEIYREVAYKARNRTEILLGVDEFLDQVTVLPPGEWDPKIRIEPPDNVPSQVAGPHVLASIETKKESHDDPTLVRTGRLFGGLIADIKRKIPYYGSDFKDCLHIQCVASTIFLFLATLTPNVTFGGLLGQATQQYMGTMECILAAAIVGILFALFSGQPLNILAFDLSALVRYITRFTEESFACLIAIIFIYEAFKKQFHILDHYGIDKDPLTFKSHHCVCGPKPMGNLTDVNVTGMHEFMTTTMAHMMKRDVGYDVVGAANVTANGTVLGFDWSSLNEAECERENGTMQGAGCENHTYPDVFFLSCILFLGTYTIAMTLKEFKTAAYFPTFVRQIFSDFAVLISIVVMVGLDMLVGIATPKLEVPEKFQPTRYQDRGWIINPFSPKNPWWTMIAAAVPALLALVEQRVTALLVGILSGLAVFLTSILKFIDRLGLLFMPAKYQPDLPYLRHVQINRVHLFTALQIICLAVLWVVKMIKSMSIAFPVMVVGTCFVRKAMNKIFTQYELSYLDDLMPGDDIIKEEDEQVAEKQRLMEIDDDDRDEREILMDMKMKHTSGDKFQGDYLSVPANDRVNITEEMGKTGIWMQVRRDSMPVIDGYNNAPTPKLVSVRRNNSKANFTLGADDIPEENENRESKI